MNNPSQLLKFTQVCMQLATEQVPPYSSKFSKHTFTQPQLVVLYCLKLKLGVTYRELIDWLGEMPRIQQALGLRQLPHFTTVQKAFARLETAIWRVLQRISATLVEGDRVAALDASGWDRSYASRHYTQRVQLKICSLKVTLLIDTGAQLVLDLHVTTTRKHDTQIAPGLTERNLDRFDTLSADKGYDDRSLRSRLRSWGKRPLIKHREFAPYDKAANAHMDSTLYHRRSLVETVISVLKRKYGAAVSSRVWWRQFRELVAMCLVYNVERALKLGASLLGRLLSRLPYSPQWRISTEPAFQESTAPLSAPAPCLAHGPSPIIRRAPRSYVKLEGLYVR
jgi:IS5 family transposase